MLIEVHMLKSFPPTCLNRDDTGAAKTCVFGGTTRGRISSQCLKRSWRISDIFRTEVGEENIGTRSRLFPTLVEAQLTAMGIPEKQIEMVRPYLSAAGSTSETGKTDGVTSQLLFFAPEDVTAYANAVKSVISTLEGIKKSDRKKAIDKAVKDVDVRPVTLDMALFGRMVTDSSFRDVEASMQVAHAISTNTVVMESDYFTALDDLLTDENTSSAGMIGDSSYNASCYYIYAALDTDELRANLQNSPDADELVKKTIPALLRAMAFTNPSGKQNSFAGHSLPSAVMVECKEKKIPTNMANAYTAPVKRHEDLVQASITKLADEADMMARNYGLEVTDRLWFCVDKYDIAPESATNKCKTYSELVDAVSAHI